MKPLLPKTSVVLMACLLTCFSVTFSFGQNIVVTSLADNGAGTLRNALTAVGTGGTITFSVAGTINLTTDHLIITKSMIINGGGTITVNASGLAPLSTATISKHVFYVNNNITGGVTFNGLTITGAPNLLGHTCGQEFPVGTGGGMGIYVRPNTTNVTIRNCYIHTNASHGIYFEGGNNDGLIRDNVISNNCNNGIQVDNASLRCSIFGNKVGTDATGTMAFGNYWDGIVVDNRSDNFVIGANTAADRNIVSANGMNIASLAQPTDRGIRIGNSANGTIRGNYVGTDITGMIALGNTRHGIFLHSPYLPAFPTAGSKNNLIEANVVSGNGTLGAAVAGGEGHGVSLADAQTTGNVLKGNIIGLNRTGVAALSNRNDGVSIFFAGSNTIGGTLGPYPADGNVISGNNFGVFIQCYATNNIVQGNYIGTNATGTAAVPNRESGVIIQGGYYNWINYLAPADNYDAPSTNNSILNNVISGNTLNGVVIQNGVFPDGTSVKPTSNNFVQGNIIGLAANGTTVLANGTNGILVDDRASANIIGGTAVSQRNVIAGNTENGIHLTGGSFNQTVQNNFIGVDINQAKKANGLDGIMIQSSNGNLIGLAASNTANVISGNTNNGVQIVDGLNNVLLSNFIGTNNTGASATVGNGLNGITISGVSTGNLIGSAASWAQRNTIAYNGENGLLINNATARLNPIRKNSFYCNILKGIELVAPVTGGNDYFATPLGQPIINNALTTMTGTTVPNAIIEIFLKDDVCNTCQGKTFVAQVTADAAGNWTYSAAFALADVQKYIITATQAGASPTNTSEFSPCSKILPVELLSFNAAQAGDNVLLTWATATEKNNKQFIVQASADGNVFTNIGSVEGAGNSASVLHYSFTYYNADPAYTYFRFIQVDLDGKRSVSPLVYLNAASGPKYVVSPNPFTDAVLLQSLNSEDAAVKVYTAAGQQVYQTQLTGFAGAQSEKIDLKDLTEGLYILVIQTATSETQFKLIKK